VCVCVWQSSWIEHIRLKMAADIVLDTVVKNGHTSSADALWAGVPVVSLAGELPHARVTASLLSNAGYNANVTLAVSAKDYEDMCVHRVPIPYRLLFLQQLCISRLAESFGWAAPTSCCPRFEPRKPSNGSQPLCSTPTCTPEILRGSCTSCWICAFHQP
jgi:Glycosyl transferase family 41